MLLFLTKGGNIELLKLYLDLSVRCNVKLSDDALKRANNVFDGSEPKFKVKQEYHENYEGYDMPRDQFLKQCKAMIEEYLKKW